MSFLKVFKGDTIGKEHTCQCRRRKRHNFDPYVGNIPWSRKWKPSLVLFPGKPPWIDDPGRLQSIWSQRVWHDQSDLPCTHVYPETHPRDSCWHRFAVLIHSTRLSSRVKSKTQSVFFFRKETKSSIRHSLLHFLMILLMKPKMTNMQHRRRVHIDEHRVSLWWLLWSCILVIVFQIKQQKLALLSYNWQKLYTFKAYNFFIGIQLLYKVVLVPAVRWVNQLYVYIHTFPLGPPTYPLTPPPLQVITEHWAELPVLYSSFPLAIYLAHGSVYVNATLPIRLTFPCVHMSIL